MLLGCGIGQQQQLIGTLAWELPYAVGVALKRPKKTKKNRNKKEMLLTTAPSYKVHTKCVYVCVCVYIYTQKIFIYIFMFILKYTILSL